VQPCAVGIYYKLCAVVTENSSTQNYQNYITIYRSVCFSVCLLLSSSLLGQSDYKCQKSCHLLPLFF